MIEKGGIVIYLCGEIYIIVNVKVCLYLCDFMDLLCGVGVNMGGLLFIFECDKCEFFSFLD